MAGFDAILTEETSRKRAERIVNAFAPSYVVAGSDETNGTVCILTFAGMPGNATPPHTHTREDETFIVHEGILEFFQEGETFIGQAGDVIHLPRGHRHYFKVTGGSPAKYTVVCIPGGFDRFYREAAEEFKKPQPDFPTLVDIAASYGIQLEAPRDS